MDRYVLVYGAYGHTGRFVVTELLRRGLTPILSGRNPARLDTIAGQFPGLEARPATVDNSRSLPGYKYYLSAADSARPAVFVTFLNMEPPDAGSQQHRG